MIRIRRLTDLTDPSASATLAECQAIIRAQFSGMPAGEIDKIPDLLINPLKRRFTAMMFVAERAHGALCGCALVLFAPDLQFSYLDILAAAPGGTGGVGAILYDAVRKEAMASKAGGLYFECLPDDPSLSPDAKTRRQNAARLRFYERYNAFPIMGTAYETPILPGGTDSPYLVFDGLGRYRLPRASRLKKIIRAILERKYATVAPPLYVENVVASIRDSTVHLRAPKYTRQEAAVMATPDVQIQLIVNDKHQIHHVRERGYVEAPVRIPAIMAELDKSGLFKTAPPKHFPEKWIRAVHDDGLVNYIIAACAGTPEQKSVYPYVFPVRNPDKKPKDKSVLAGYWCIDTFTPLNRNAYPAARRAVDCALTAADYVRKGAPIAYALVRPPGHHAERRVFGGFCYFNNAAIAANYLAQDGRVAVLDVDYHHGNGTQDIFYERADVLTLSIHGDPSIAYPYFSGFRGERGTGAGLGFNVNMALPEHATPEDHREALGRALKHIAHYQPRYLVVALGLDPARGDPTGTWSLRGDDFRIMGKMIGSSGLPLIVVQEGGYLTRTLGTNARSFFEGLIEGRASAPPKLAAQETVRSARSKTSIRLSEDIKPADVERIRALVDDTGFFTSDEIDIAKELVEERLKKGEARSGYSFVLLEQGSGLIGYACYGLTSGTEASYDLYWIVVALGLHGRGYGQRILNEVEKRIAALGGKKIYVDTSSTQKYAPTRGFYERTGFVQVAILHDFYRPGDSKVIYEKPLVANGWQQPRRDR